MSGKSRLISGSVRNRLAALFFVITATAVGFIYLYVVPQLRSNLTAQKLQRLEQVGTDEGSRLAGAMRGGISQQDLHRLVRRVAQRTDARVTVLAVRSGPAGAEPAFVVGDSEFERCRATRRRRPPRRAAKPPRESSASPASGPGRPRCR